jgi:thioredoxin-related protein
MMTRAAIALVCLALTGQIAVAQSDSPAPQIKAGEYRGAANAKHPLWFKESFLDFSEDIDEATADGKRLSLYFWQAGCPYCNRLWEHNMAVEGIEDEFQSNFDVVAINMWGDQEVVTVAGKQFTEKQLARALDVDFTPTLLFYDEQKKSVLRLNGYLPPERFKLALAYASGEHAEGQGFNEYVLSQLPSSTGLARKQSFFKAPDEALKDRSQQAGDRPLAVIFETADCTSCEQFHDLTLAHSDTRGLLAQMDVVQLDARSNIAITLPNGGASTPVKWAAELGLAYFPSIAFFDEKGEQVMLMDTYFRNFHTQSVFAYVLEKGYLEQPSFQRYISARVDDLNVQGIDVDIWEE